MGHAGTDAPSKPLPCGGESEGRRGRGAAAAVAVRGAGAGQQGQGVPSAASPLLVLLGCCCRLGLDREPPPRARGWKDLRGAPSVAQALLLLSCCCCQRWIRSSARPQGRGLSAYACQAASSEREWEKDEGLTGPGLRGWA